jgi:hypothetical protein
LDGKRRKSPGVLYGSQITEIPFPMFHVFPGGFGQKLGTGSR